MSGLFGIVLLIWIVALLVLYHKVFEVYYFSLSYGLMKELIVAVFIGMIMTVLTFYLWWITAIIILIVGFANMSKSGNKAHIIVAVILAIVISIIGISVRSNAKSANEGARMNEITIVQEYIA